ncbi:hypothetical protein [Novosphingobium album (ex Liu et al. 2023)]|uniref:Uncharacterized protein n=1 Tax=Novosphingobium album (ex Liu et al. 2023) TaxID=3031130 RepID=A0ABT5WKB6_9SPHN|nr:hypothetical protein [Novosphingobium album (ex Liu et al. 2023)]MDE8650496.1 hypothetical protein [Novosphingobium album (ex Liu et al. 2023)]
MKMLKSGASILGAFSIVMGDPMARANIACQGPVTYLDIQPGGIVAIDMGFGWWQMCNLGGNWTPTIDGSPVTITPTACQGILAALMTTKAQKQNITLLMTGSTSADCYKNNSQFQSNYPYNLSIMNDTP